MYYNQSLRYPVPTTNVKEKEKKKKTDDHDVPFYDDGAEISFVNADLRKYDWSDADVVFANSTCFDEKLMEELSTACERLRKGTYVISLTKKIKSDHFQCLESKQYRMSWGYATVHTQIKIKDPPGLSTSSLSPSSSLSLSSSSSQNGSSVFKDNRKNGTDSLDIHDQQQQQQQPDVDKSVNNDSS